jgi:hypothetical protein
VILDAEFAERQARTPVFLSKSAQAIESKGQRLKKEQQESARVRKKLKNRELRHAEWKRGERFDENNTDCAGRACRIECVGMVESEVSEGGWATIMAEDSGLVI